MLADKTNSVSLLDLTQLQNISTTTTTNTPFVIKSQLGAKWGQLVPLGATFFVVQCVLMWRIVVRIFEPHCDTWRQVDL